MIVVVIVFMTLIVVLRSNHNLDNCRGKGARHEGYLENLLDKKPIKSISVGNHIQLFDSGERESKIQNMLPVILEVEDMYSIIKKSGEEDRFSI